MGLAVQDEITDIVLWYRDLPADFLGINDLINNRQKLVGYNVEFATELGLARQIWSVSKAIYEKKKIQLRVKYKSEGTGNADAISRANSVTEYLQQQEAEGEYYKLYYLSKSYVEVLSAMSQSIAVLREELSSIKYKGG